MFTKSVFLCSAILFSAACAVESTSSTSGAIIEMPCAADTDCPTAFECQIEVEHGVTTTFCKSEDDTDATCPAGYEAEVEHAQTFCKPHGGSGGGSGGSGGSGGGTGTTGATCTTDADCTVGLECELEIEHGQTTSTCQPHGGV